MDDSLLGTAGETAVFGPDGIGYTPHGVEHAVDRAALAPRGVLAYARCGTPVRVWPDVAFDPDSPRAHPGCCADRDTGGAHQ